MKAPSPLLGFNNNVRHRGRVFHIQTEDSGIRHPHVITHLFADGGRILKTTKTSYVEHLGEERLAETVRAMMQDQHKAMFIALRDGQFDYLFDESGSPASLKTAPKPVPEAVVLPPPPPSPTEAPQGGGPTLAEGSSAAPSAAVAAPLALPTLTDDPPVPLPPFSPPPVSPPPPHPPAPVVVVPPAQVVVAAQASVVVVPPAPFVVAQGKLPQKPVVPRPVSHLAPTEPQRAAVFAPAPALAGHPQAAVAELSLAPPQRRRGTSRPTLDVDPGAIHGVSSSGEASIDLDLDALERAAAEAQTPFFQQIQDLPPPPAAVLGSKRASTGGYSVRSPTPPESHEGSPRPQAPSPPAPPPLGAPSPGRYAPSRPASIFATTRPQEGASIFGEDLISEKSLDEVILSYLAEDLDGPVEKK